MAALTTTRDTPERGGIDRAPGVAADAVIFAGSLVCLNASGFAVPGAVATTLTAIGRAEAGQDFAAIVKSYFPGTRLSQLDY